MTFRDQHDLPIAGAGAADCAAYDRYVDTFLSYGADIRDLFAAADANPECTLLNAHAAGLQMAFEGAEGFANAAPHLARMRRTLSGASAREQLFCQAIEAWGRRDYRGALDRLDELTVRWPADICALKWAQYHAFNLGDQPALMRLGDRATVAHEGRPYIHGLRAFALEQNHRLDEAEHEGLRATEIALDDGWAHHAVAHVHEARGQWRRGARWMEKCAHTWERKGLFIREHNWWHAGLFHLHLGDAESALSIYDARLWGELPQFPQEQIGAVSFLWRLEMHGVDVGARWEPVAQQARARIGEHILPFHDLHYVYALARTGAHDEVEAQISQMTRYADELTGSEPRAAWIEAAAPAARGSAAFARQDWDEAVEHLARALPRLDLVGGSHAQRHTWVAAFETAKAHAANARAQRL